MSRSYRKNLVITDSSTNHRYQPRTKAIANRATRRTENQRLRSRSFAQSDFDGYSPVRNQNYRKMFESYDIRDFSFRYDNSGRWEIWRWKRK